MSKGQSKNKDRKPIDYDEKDVPKVLKGPISPLGLRKDYDALGPLRDGRGPHGPRKLTCPGCGQVAPLDLTELPGGIPFKKVSIRCNPCGRKIPLVSVGLAEDGDYTVFL